MSLWSIFVQYPNREPVLRELAAPPQTLADLRELLEVFDDQSLLVAPPEQGSTPVPLEDVAQLVDGCQLRVAVPRRRIFVSRSDGLVQNRPLVWYPGASAEQIETAIVKTCGYPPNTSVELLDGDMAVVISATIPNDVRLTASPLPPVDGGSVASNRGPPSVPASTNGRKIKSVESPRKPGMARTATTPTTSGSTRANSAARAGTAGTNGSLSARGPPSAASPPSRAASAVPSNHGGTAGGGASTPTPATGSVGPTRMRSGTPQAAATPAQGSPAGMASAGSSGYPGSCYGQLASGSPNGSCVGTASYGGAPYPPQPQTCGTPAYPSSPPNLYTSSTPSLGGPLGSPAAGSGCHLAQPSAPAPAPAPAPVGNADEHCVRLLAGHGGPVLSLCTVGDVLFTGAQDCNIMIWDLNNLQYIGTLPGHSGAVKCMAAALSRKMLCSGSQDRTIKVWSLESFSCTKTFLGHRSEVTVLAILDSPEVLLSGSEDRSIRVWDIVSLTLLASLEQAHFNSIVAIQALRPGAFMTASSDRSIKVWSTTSWQAQQTLGPTHFDAVSDLVVGPLGAKIWSTARDRSIRRWDAATLECDLQVANAHADCVSCLSVGASETSLFSGCRDSTIKVWDRDLRCKFTLVGHRGPVNALLAVDGHLFSASHDRTVRVWRVDHF